jgi:predicted RNase H-like nuclease
VIEVHPELCFFGLAGIPLSESKRQKQGFERRRQILQDYLGIEVLQRAEVQKAVRAKPDDYLDALVAAVAASAYSEGKARHIPEFEEVDECGLAMRMWFPCASE